MNTTVAQKPIAKPTVDGLERLKSLTALRELPRRLNWFIDDFGMSQMQFTGACKLAAQGNGKSRDEAIKKIDPMLQAFLDAMGEQRVMRPKLDEFSKPVTEVTGMTDDGKEILEVVYVERTEWGINENDVHSTSDKVPRPKVGQYRLWVLQHWAEFAQALEFLPSDPVQYRGKYRDHYTAFETHIKELRGERGEENLPPDRKSAIEFIKPYLNGKQHTWDGK